MCALFSVCLSREEPQPNRRISDAGANPYPYFLHERPGTGTCKNKALNEDKPLQVEQSHLDPYPHAAGVLRRCSQLQDYKAFPDKRNHYVDRSQWQITENVHEPIIDRTDFETVQRILENAPSNAPTGTGKSTLCRACFSVRIAVRKCTFA